MSKLLQGSVRLSEVTPRDSNAPPRLVSPNLSAAPANDKSSAKATRAYGTAVDTSRGWNVLAQLQQARAGWQNPLPKHLGSVDTQQAWIKTKTDANFVHFMK